MIRAAHLAGYCSVISTSPASEFEYKFVQALTQEGVYLAWDGMPYAFPYLKHGKTQIDCEGKLQPGFRPSFEGLPPSLRVICDKVSQSAQVATERFFGLLRWTQRDDTPFKAVSSTWLYWRTNGGGEYQRVGLKRQEHTTESTGGIKWADADQKLLRSVWQDAKNEPLAHELWREGWYLVGCSPRTALLMLATALETGVTRHISSVEPTTKWLRSNIPSPSVHKLYKDYLPNLYAEKNIDHGHWSQLSDFFKTLQKIYEARNELVYRLRLMVQALD